MEQLNEWLKTMNCLSSDVEADIGSDGLANSSNTSCGCIWFTAQGGDFLRYSKAGLRLRLHPELR